LLTVDDPFVTGTPVSTYAYDPGSGRQTTRTDAQANLRWERTYEANTGRLDTQVIKDDTSGATLASFDLGYDLAGNVSSKASSVFSNPANGTWGYSYDGASRLTRATGPNASGASTTYDYAYDGGGNRILDQQTTGTLVRNLTTTYDAAGLPTSATDAATGESVTYAHDAIGDLTGIDSSIAANDWTYAYDPYARLTCAVQGTSCASGSSRVLFTLDALDRALTRTKGSTTTSFTYQGIAESVAKTVNGSTTTTYAYSGGGAPLAESTAGAASFYLRDTHGDVVSLASTAAANQGTSSFDPWGKSLAVTGQTSFLGYQGDMTDPDTKQVDMGTRWYAAGLGRFTSRDVIFGDLASPMTLNQHVYGGMNPITMWDPTGMYQDDAGGGGGCGAHPTNSCQQAIEDNTEYYEEHYSSRGGGSGSSGSSGNTTLTSQRPPRPEAARIRISPTDVAVGLGNRVMEFGTALDREARAIYNGAGLGFVEGRAVQTWLTIADARYLSGWARASRLGGGLLRGALRVAPAATGVWDTAVGIQNGAPPSGEIARNALAAGSALAVEKAGVAACAPSAAAGGAPAVLCAGAVTIAAAITYAAVRAGIDPEDMAEVVDHLNPYGNTEGWVSLIHPSFG
jgi:RHS repeat-associated protein